MQKHHITLEKWMHYRVFLITWDDTCCYINSQQFSLVSGYVVSSLILSVMLSSSNPYALSRALALATGAKWIVGLIRKPNILLELACLSNFAKTKRFVSQINKWEASTALHTKKKKKKTEWKKEIILFIFPKTRRGVAKFHDS